MSTVGNWRGPNIVKDGLVLYLDAGSPNSYYPAIGGTTWKDISGNNNNGTLINSPTYNSLNGGSFVFDGVNDYTMANNNIPSLVGNKSFSICGWFKRSGDWSNGASWGIGGDSTLGGINSWNSNSSNQITIDLWGTTTFTTSQTYSLTEWKYICWVYNGVSFTTSNIIIYINNIQYTGVGLTTLRGGGGTPNITNPTIVLGRAGVTTNLYYGKPIISQFACYNRALTQQEVLQNFNATRARFGI